MGWEDGHEFEQVLLHLEKEMEPTSIFLPGKSHGQRSLAGYNPWGLKELDTTERLNNNNNN